MTPEQIATSGSEHAHQSALFCWAALEINNKQIYPNCNAVRAGLSLMFAIPNGGMRSKATAAMLRAEGVKSGVPDICLPFPVYMKKPDHTGIATISDDGRTMKHGLFIEMKKPTYKTHKNGGCSDDQLDWHKGLRLNGYRVEVCYTWTEARDVILNYLGG